ncbi:MAG TPA: hypothetical protein VGM63_19290 [Mucilaginibacter sp.]|jgi:hypothetical protein
MKKLLIAAFIGLGLSACNNDKKQEEDLKNDLLKVHDKVMAHDDQLMKNKIQLDSLLKIPAKDTAEKVNIKAIDLKLTAAEEAMDTWMGNFKPDFVGKSHDEIMKYYGDQKKGIMSVDSQMNVAVTESGKYLSNRKK